MRLPVARGRTRRIRLDTVDLGDPQRPRGRTRAAARQGACRLRVHGRRLRRESRLSTTPSCSPPSSRSGPGARWPARVTRRDENIVGGNRNATRQLVTAAAPRGRHPHSTRRRVHLRARMGRLARADGRPCPAPVRLRQRADRRARRQAESAADDGLPCTRLRRGHVVARVPPRQARRTARNRPAGAAKAQLRRRRHDGRPSLLLEGADGVLPASRAALGAPARGARALRRDLEARDGYGEPDLVRRRRPAELRVGPARLGRPRERRHRDAGHRDRHPDGDGADRGRGARSLARPGRRSSSATRPAAPTPPSPAARRRSRPWARPYAPRPPTPPAR